MANITKCYYELADYENAKIIANKILAIIPESEEAQNIINKINQRDESERKK